MNYQRLYQTMSTAVDYAMAERVGWRVAELVHAMGRDFSDTDKMPCRSTSLSALDCITGTRLRKIPGSVCEGCYAHGGRYCMPNVIEAMEARKNALMKGAFTWAAAHVLLMRKRKMEFFRWHDSGDLQSPAHLIAIILIAERVPECKFWLPTKEVGIVNKVLGVGIKVPDNLTIRVSHYMVDKRTKAVEELVSKYQLTASTATTEPEPDTWHCHATWTDDHRCGSCRACWDRDVPVVNYKYEKR